MRFRVIGICGALLLPLCFVGCYLAPVVPPGGILYSNVGSVIDADADRTPVSPDEGRASSKSVLGLVAWGNSGVTAAAEQGELVSVDQVDYEYYNILLVYQKLTVVVRGNRK